MLVHSNISRNSRTMKRLLIQVGCFFCVGLMSLSLLSSAQTGQDYDVLVQQGNAQLQAGSNDLALSTANSAVKLNADRWEAYALAGGALMNLKRYEEAVDNFGKAIERAPEAKQQGLRGLRKQCLLAEAGAAPAAVPPSSSAATQPAATTQAEVVLWKSIENSTNPEDFQTYLSQYPQGAFVELAKRHLADLAQQQIQDQKLRDQAAEAAREAGTTFYVQNVQGGAWCINGQTQILNIHEGGITYRGTTDSSTPCKKRPFFNAKCSEIGVTLNGGLEVTYAGDKYQFILEQAAHEPDSQYEVRTQGMVDAIRRECPRAVRDR